MTVLTTPLPTEPHRRRAPRRLAAARILLLALAPALPFGAASAQEPEPWFEEEICSDEIISVGYDRLPERYGRERAEENLRDDWANVATGSLTRKLEDRFGPGAVDWRTDDRRQLDMEALFIPHVRKIETQVEGCELIKEGHDAYWRCATIARACADYLRRNHDVAGDPPPPPVTRPSTRAPAPEPETEENLLEICRRNPQDERCLAALRERAVDAIEDRAADEIRDRLGIPSLPGFGN